MVDDRLKEILKRTDSIHLAELWMFYRPNFENDEQCLQFFSDIFSQEPILDIRNLDLEKVKEDPAREKLLAPRRMTNAVERMVTAARDMDQIRKGKDIFKLVFLVTCLETLEKLSGSSSGKKEMLFHFFRTYTSEDDKCYIRKEFRYEGEEEREREKDSFEQFLGVLNEYRNSAVHEGQYWERIFKAQQDDSSLFMPSTGKKKDLCFTNGMTYLEFEAIFVRNSIRFIQEHLKKPENND